MLRQKISNNKGLSLAAVVIVMLIVSTLALLTASFMSSGNISAITDMQAEQAFFIANAGMECYLELLEADSDWSTPPAVLRIRHSAQGCLPLLTIIRQQIQ